MPKKNEENQIEKLNEEIDILEGLIEEPDVNSTIIANIEDLNEEIDDKGEELTKEVENNTEIKQNSKIENLKKQIDNLNDEREKNEKIKQLNIKIAGLIEIEKLTKEFANNTEITKLAGRIEGLNTTLSQINDLKNNRKPTQMKEQKEWENYKNNFDSIDPEDKVVKIKTLAFSTTEEVRGIIQEAFEKNNKNAIDKAFKIVDFEEEDKEKIREALATKDRNMIDKAFTEAEEKPEYQEKKLQARYLSLESLNPISAYDEVGGLSSMINEEVRDLKLKIDKIDKIKNTTFPEWLQDKETLLKDKLTKEIKTAEEEIKVEEKKIELPKNKLISEKKEKIQDIEKNLQEQKKTQQKIAEQQKPKDVGLMLTKSIEKNESKVDSKNQQKKLNIFKRFGSAIKNIFYKKTKVNIKETEQKKTQQKHEQQQKPKALGVTPTKNIFKRFGLAIKNIFYKKTKVNIKKEEIKVNKFNEASLKKNEQNIPTIDNSISLKAKEIAGFIRKNVVNSSVSYNANSKSAPTKKTQHGQDR